MSLFDGFRKKKENKEIITTPAVGVEKDNNDTALNDCFKTGSKAIINSISSSMISILRMLFIAYKNNGTVTMAMVNKNPTYYENKEFEDLLIALGNTKTLDNSKTYLQLAQEFMSPPADLGNEEAIVFRFAHDILTSNNPNYEEFESFVNSKISGTDKDFSAIPPQKKTVEYTCPMGQTTAKDMEKYDHALKATLENAAIDAGISTWFRWYKELTLCGFEYVQKVFRQGQAVTDLMKLPGMRGNSNQAFSVLCGYVLNAGIVYGKEYCDKKGNIEAVKVSLSGMTKEDFADSAARIFGFDSGIDPTFLKILSPIPIAAANFIANNKANPSFFMNSMLITLNTVFQFGTGLYYEN